MYDVSDDLVPFVQFKNRKNTVEEVLLLVKFTKSNTPPWVFFTFSKLYKWYQIAQSTSYNERFEAMSVLSSRFFGNDLKQVSLVILNTSE